jgi:hypothetical protein
VSTSGSAAAASSCRGCGPGKTLGRNCADRAAVVRAALEEAGIEVDDLDELSAETIDDQGHVRYLWIPVTSAEIDSATYVRVMATAITQRQRWREQYTAAPFRPRPRLRCGSWSRRPRSCEALGSTRHRCGAGGGVRPAADQRAPGPGSQNGRSLRGAVASTHPAEPRRDLRSDLAPQHVRSWQQALLDAGLDRVTVAKAYRLLKAVMSTAADDELIRRTRAG